MTFPDPLRTNFELVKQLPSSKPFDVFLVKDKSKDLRLCVLRLLPASLSGDKAIVDAFMAYFSKFSEIINRAYIPTVYSVSGQPGGNVYVLEEHVPGIDLKKFIQKNRSDPDFNKEIIVVIGKVCEALHHAHQKDIFHLAITPEDILIDESAGRVKLVGFGVQTFAQVNKISLLSAQTRTTIAPEVLIGKSCKPSADVYSLAKAINEACREIFSNNFSKALANNPSGRYQTARDFESALNNLLKGIEKASKPKTIYTSMEAKGGLKPVLTKQSVTAGTGSHELSGRKSTDATSKPIISVTTTPIVTSPKAPQSNSPKMLAGVAAMLVAIVVGIGLYAFQGQQKVVTPSKETADVSNAKPGTKKSDGDVTKPDIRQSPEHLRGPSEYGSASLPSPLRLRWRVRIPISGNKLVTSGGLLIFFQQGGPLTALDILSGTEKWKIHDSSPDRLAVDDGLVYFKDRDGYLNCMVTTNQTIKWRFGKKSSSEFIVVDRGMLFTDNCSGDIYALDAITGREFWVYDGDHVQEPVVHKNVVCFRDSNRHQIIGLDFMTGEIKWVVNYDGPNQPGYEIHNGLLFHAIKNNDEYSFRAIDVKTSQVKWTRRCDDYTWCKPAILDNMIFVKGRNNLRSLDINTGQELWRTESGPMNSCPIVAQGTVYFRAGDKLYAFDCKNGKKKWVVKAGSLNHCDEGSILVTDDGVLYFADTDEGYLYSFNTR